jgi:hypothetical protein
MTARQYESMRKTYLNLQQVEEKPSALPVYPQSPPGAVPPASAAPPAKPVRGRLISSVFQEFGETAGQEPQPEEPASQKTPARRRLLSPLFDPPPDEKPL